MTYFMPPDLLKELEDLGIPYGKVSLAEHRDTWENTAQKLIRVLWQILGDYPLDIEHVGSTAIRSIPAKPVLDIAVGVADLSRLESYRDALSENGIRIVGELNPGQIMCDMTNARGLECVHIHFLPPKGGRLPQLSCVSGLSESLSGGSEDLRGPQEDAGIPVRG